MATRHNFGFLLLDRVAQALRNTAGSRLAKTREVSGLGRWEHYFLEDRELHLLWPLTFMNLSGQAIERLLSMIQRDDFCTRRDILVALDDLSLPLGRIRLRAKGSSGGHNGLNSVESHLGHKEYSRLKLGIGRPDGQEPVVDFVLQAFTSEELPLVERVLDFVTPEVLRWLRGSEVSELSQTVNGWTAWEPPAGERTDEASPL